MPKGKNENNYVKTKIWIVSVVEVDIWKGFVGRYATQTEEKSPTNLGFVGLRSSKEMQVLETPALARVVC